MTDTVLIAALLVLFLLAVFLAAAEASLLRVPRVRVAVLADDGDRGARRLLRMIDDLPRVINTVLLTVLLVQIGAATLSGVFAERHFGGVGITITSIVLTLVLFVYAEAIPKTYAVRHPLAVARRVSLPVQGMTWLFKPIVSSLVWFADLQAPGRGIASQVGVSEVELRQLAAEAATAGEIEASDVELLERAFELGDTRVDQILVPRPDIVAVAADKSIHEALEVALSTGHRRLPVFHGDIDRIIGVVRLRDLAAAVTQGRDDTAEGLSSAVLVVPESKRVIELLREMQKAGLHFAVAIDEHGGTAGIVTIEDVVAELVGEVTNEGERRPDDIRVVDGKLLVAATTNVDELAEHLETEFPDGDFHTVGGLVIDAAGRIPAVGEVVTVGDYQIQIVSGSRRRVRTVEILGAGVTDAS